MSKRSSDQDNQVDHEIDDQGYNNKGVRRQHKKKVAKYKQYEKWEEDSY